MTLKTERKEVPPNSRVATPVFGLDGRSLPGSAHFDVLHRSPQEEREIMVFDLGEELKDRLAAIDASAK